MAKVYDKTGIEQKLNDYPGWTLGEDGQLHRELTFKNFAQAMLYASAVGHLADTADHHPDLFVHSYKNLRISLMTHSEKGITDKDFDLIEQIDALPRRA